MTTIDAGDLQFNLSEKMVLSNISYKSDLLIESISFLDDEPKGLDDLFKERYIGLDSKAFNRTESMIYDLSVELAKNKTEIFASGKSTSTSNTLSINFIVKVKENTILIEAHAQTKYKAYWGLTCEIKLSEKSNLLEKNDNKVKRIKKWEYSSDLNREISSDKTKVELDSSYGHIETPDPKTALLMPTMSGNDREVINSWRIKPNYKNFHVLKLIFKQ